jgi:hypothetical protein
VGLAREFVSRYGVPDSAVPKGFDVRRFFARRPLRRRIIALAAAYAIALGGLFASFAAASAAAAAATVPGTITCHSDAAGTPSPAQNDKSGVCIDSCCIGCVMLMAALPPPPIKAIGAPQSVAQPLAPAAAVAGPAATSIASHQSRAPPHRA